MNNIFTINVYSTLVCTYYVIINIFSSFAQNLFLKIMYKFWHE